MNPRLSCPTLALSLLLSLISTPALHSQDQPKLSPAPAPHDLGSLPDHTTELGRRAAAAFSRGEWKKARDAYSEMVAADPENPLALSNLGVAEFQLKEYDAARTHFEKALRNNPKLAQTWITLGLVHFQKNELDLAISALTRALHEDPADPRAHRYLAIVLRARGWLTGAEAELRKAIELNPKDAEAHFNLALVYLDRQDPTIELGRRHYHRALDLGAAPDPEIERQLKEASLNKTVAPPAP